MKHHPPNSDSGSHFSPCYDSRCELRVASSSLSVSAITALLGVEPTAAREVVESCVSAGGDGLRDTQNYWQMSLEAPTTYEHHGSQDLSRSLDRLIERLHSISAPLAVLQSISGVKMNVTFVLRGSDWVALSQGQMRALATMNLELTFDLQLDEDEV